MRFVQFLACVALASFQLWPFVQSKCSRLPSGKCWVTCMETVFNIICNGVTANEVQNDIKVFSGTVQKLRLYIWSSPDIRRLSSDVFLSVADQILFLDVQDLYNLDTFPEIYLLSNLERLSIWNSPQITTLSLELVPKSIWWISLNKLGIRDYVNDFFEVPALPKLEKLILRNMTIQKWQPNFLDVFPSLKELRISNSTILVEEPKEPLSMTRPLTSIHISSNSFHNESSKGVDGFLRSLLRSLRPAPGGVLDLTDNDVPWTKETFEALQKYTNASDVVLGGNRILPYTAMPNTVFSDYAGVRRLDLSGTSLVPVAGLFRNLPSLTSLILAHNNLENLTSVDMFENNLSANLTYLDLSYNGIHTLPVQASVLKVLSSLSTLNLRGNRLDFLAAPPIDNKFFGALTNVSNLDLGDNGLTSFHGTHLTSLVQLNGLDLSCNRLDHITKQTFLGMPTSLRELDISQCIQPPATPPVVDSDAFTTLPPIRVLRLNTGSFKQWILPLLTFSNETTYSIEEIYLDGNSITSLKAGILPSLPNLKVLSLRSNLLQSIAPAAFVSLPQLKTLLLSDNLLQSIERHTFAARDKAQMQTLEVLDVARNGISHIKSGAFDFLPRLKSLMIGWNPVDIDGLFNEGGEELAYIGIQDYNSSCLRPEFYKKLRKLKYVFLDDYNFLRVSPDKSLLKRDEYLLSVKKDCTAGGEVLPDHELYPGLASFVSVTVHDADEGTGPQYPVLSAFLPLSYCPMDDYIGVLRRMICQTDANTVQS